MTDKFHERFNITVDLTEARQRFLNRIKNEVYEGFLFEYYNHEGRIRLARVVSSHLGDRFTEQYIQSFVGNDFYRNLQAIEALYTEIYQPDLSYLEQKIKWALSQCEVAIGIEWRDGKFYKSGARNLDEGLVNDELHWLRDKKYENVLTPFAKGLDHFLHSEKRPHLLADVVTDMYEALEALAKIVTGRQDEDLSANQQLFISKVKASPLYKKLLADYIEYANDFRHAVKQGQEKPPLSAKEVESFIYLTGLFIRLAM